MKKISILLLCGETNRAKAYLNVLKGMKQINVHVILYGYNESYQIQPPITLDSQTEEYLEEIGVKAPDFNLSTLQCLSEIGFSHTVMKEKDVNSDEVLEAINKVDAQYVVFGGYGGQILSSAHFNNRKKYIHCHPGWLPQERGSTTIYYSLLKNRPPSVTAFFMSAEIDKGGLIIRESFPIPSNIINFDVFGDNLMRAETLKRALQNLLKDNFEPFYSNASDEEHYVIHPLLKHIGLLTIKSEEHNK